MKVWWKTAALLLMAAALSGCMLSRAEIRQADAVVAATTDRAPECDRPDRCAHPSILLDAAEGAAKAPAGQATGNIVALLDGSDAALAARLNLIHGARSSVEVQTYLWDRDDAGMLVMDALVRAARRGVKVRVLIDQLGAFDDLDVLARLARASPNLAVKLYNPTFDDARTSGLQWVAGIVCCFAKLNQRMHNKLLLVDDVAGITGGRNYQDRYFNWDDSFDYVDRDVWVGGTATAAMAASFDLFWNNRRSVGLTHLHDLNRYIVSHPVADDWAAPGYSHPDRVHRMERLAADPAWLEANVLAAAIRTPNVEYFSDLPAKADDPQKRAAAAFTRRVMQMIGGARQEVILQTPYLVISKQAGRLFRTLRRENPAPRITVSTNSLASTDAFVTYAMAYKHRKRYLKGFGFEIYELKPHAPGAAEGYVAANPYLGPGAGRGAAEEGERPMAIEGPGRNLFGSQGRGRKPAPLLSEGVRFSVHAKSIVVDDQFAMVGSHNFDPRSDHYNTEAGVIVRDRAFATQVRTSVLRATQPENAWVIAPRQEAVPLLSPVNQTLAEVSARLPVFDLWPFRYATSYQLKPGCQPLRIIDPGFYACYEPVGDFPDVAVSPRWIYTRLFTAFGAGVSGIL